MRENENTVWTKVIIESHCVSKEFIHVVSFVYLSHQVAEHSGFMYI